MTYLRDRPLASEQLKTSQPVILNNFNDADTYFAVDHYAFSDNNANSGKHQSVTNPVVPGTTTHQSTAANEPKIYGMTVGATNNNSVIQWSRGPSDAVPTPITFIQSPSANQSIGAINGTLDLYDFAGMNDVIANVNWGNFSTTSNRTAFGRMTVHYISATTSLAVLFISRGGELDTFFNKISPGISGTVLRLVNTNTTAVHSIQYCIEFLRIRV